MSWEEKCRLIQSDPVTCARHFDYQFNKFLREFLMSNIGPLGKLNDWFYRVEYQQRGSPHIHMLIWLENAPVFGVSSDDDVISFVDKIITCELPADQSNLVNLVNRQTHKHSHTCRKRLMKECRFNYPQPPMTSTKILYPLNDTMSQSRVKQLKALWKIIKQQLDDMKEGDNVSHGELLDILNVSEDESIFAIRSSLSCPTVFLKRKPNELRINNYNSACLSAWRASKDAAEVMLQKNDQKRELYALYGLTRKYIQKSILEN